MQANYQNLYMKKRRNIELFIGIDVLMLFILTLNISWFIFDWFFALEGFNDYLSENVNSFYNSYLHIHKNFLYYDLIFIGIYFIEFFIRWLVAVKQKLYYRWFLFPFIHIYDLLGMIPTGSWLVLRFIRLIPVIYKLNKLKIINISKTYFYKKLRKYYYIVVEEISDRVVINVLNGVQDEIKSGTNIAERVIKEIIIPKKELLINIISDKIRIISKGLFDIHKDELAEYVEQNVDIVFEKNKEAKMIKKIPVLGSTIQTTVKKSIKDIIYQVIENIINDITTTNNQDKIKEISNTIFDSFISDFYKDIDEILDTIVIDTIDIFKDQVKIQQWKINEQKE